MKLPASKKNGLFSKTQWEIPKKPIQIQSKAIHIWAADLSSHATQWGNNRRVLSQDECEKADRYKFEKNKNDYITARAILRKILGYYLTIEPEKIRFSYNPYGKPYLNLENNKNHLYFNLSHSGDLVLYIFSSDYEVGIDVEKLHCIDDFQNIAKGFFSEAEYLKLISLPHFQRQDAFFKCWTRKEAFIKAIGNGLSYPLDQFEVTLLPDESPALLNILGDSKSIPEWSLYALEPAPNYEAAFVFKGSCHQVDYFKFDSTA